MIFHRITYLCIVFILGCNISQNKKLYLQMPEDEKIQYGIIAKTGQLLKKQKDLTFIGSGGGKDNGINMMSISLTYNKKINIQKARKLIIYSAKIFLNEINSNKDIRQYLNNYPFTYKNIKIFITIENSPNKTYLSPDISSFFLSNGKIYYYEDGKNEMLKEIHEETYDEALKLLENEKK